MKNDIYIREMRHQDLAAIKAVVDDNQMFPSEYLDEMVLPYLNQTSEDKWFVAENDAKDVIAVVYCAPERMTDGTWNMLLIAVLERYQGIGIGGQLIAHVENTLKKQKARVLLVETSGLDEYKLTRAFYPKCGYSQVAVIPEYYASGDDKVVFLKSLVTV